MTTNDIAYAYEEQIKKLTKQNEKLSLQLQEFNAKHQSQIALLKKKLMIINETLVNKVNENELLENKIKYLEKQNQRLKGEFSEFEYRNQHQQKIMRIENEGLVKQFNGVKNEQFNRVKNEVERLNIILSKTINECKEMENLLQASYRQNSQYRGKIEEYENRISLLSSQVERLNQILRIKTGHQQEYKNKSGKLISELVRLNNALG